MKDADAQSLNLHVCKMVLYWCIYCILYTFYSEILKANSFYSPSVFPSFFIAHVSPTWAYLTPSQSGCLSRRQVITLLNNDVLATIKAWSAAGLRLMTLTVGKCLGKPLGWSPVIINLKKKHLYIYIWVIVRYIPFLRLPRKLKS